MNIDIEVLNKLFTADVDDRPKLIICDARSEYGQKVLAERDGEMEFDGFWHAYIRRGNQTLLVPLWELHSR
jgi:hypothetical protein